MATRLTVTLNTSITDGATQHSECQQMARHVAGLGAIVGFDAQDVGHAQ
jgi:hypothetical protein